MIRNYIPAIATIERAESAHVHFRKSKLSTLTSYQSSWRINIEYDSWRQLLLTSSGTFGAEKGVISTANAFYCIIHDSNQEVCDDEDDEGDEDDLKYLVWMISS